jgi:hypothetical protein
MRDAIESLPRGLFNSRRVFQLATAGRLFHFVRGGKTCREIAEVGTPGFESPAGAFPASGLGAINLLSQFFSDDPRAFDHRAQLGESNIAG